MNHIEHLARKIEISKHRAAREARETTIPGLTKDAAGKMSYDPGPQPDPQPSPQLDLGLLGAAHPKSAPPPAPKASSHGSWRDTDHEKPPLSGTVYQTIHIDPTKNKVNHGVWREWDGTHWLNVNNGRKLLNYKIWWLA